MPGRGREATWRCFSGCVGTVPGDWVTGSSAAREGHLAVLQWARQAGARGSSETCGCGAGGHLEVLQWLRRTGCLWEEDTCSAAAEEGHLEVLEWAHLVGAVGRVHVRVRGGGGHLEVLQACRNGCEWDEDKR